MINPWDVDEDAPCLWPGGCKGRTPIAGNYCPEHRAAFYARLDEPASVTSATPIRGQPGAADMSPEAVAARKLAKVREAEAIAWVTAYRGSWGLPLDIRASEKWGTKYMHLTERQVNALLAGRDRDIARNAEVANAATDPVTIWLKGLTGHTGGFLASLIEQVKRGSTLSPRQREVAQRIMDEQKTRPAITIGPSQPVAGITEGMYRDPQSETIWKVVKAVHGSGRLYAQRLVIEDKSGRFEYAGGAIRSLRVEWKMTLEQAKEFGSLYGFCVRCSATLTDDASIKAGIGPICAGRF